MDKFIKYAAIGLAGYFIGFYEMKYKVMKVMLEADIDKDKQDEKTNEN